jgi:diadenosine tetraphosphatase ApaH/serine/threonine PP2A family protein phosphatase
MRIAVVSDVHSNLPALEAVIEAVGEVDAWWHCGDIVGYGPHPNEVVERLRGLGARGVLGNHDAAALGSDIVAWFNPWAQEAAAWTARRLSADARAWIEALPDRLFIDGWTLVHGSARDPMEEYVTSEAVAAATLAIVETVRSLHGHTHVPVAWREIAPSAEKRRPVYGEALAFGSDRWLLNPGSVGQPRDRDPRASALVLDMSADTATWLRVEYPIAKTQADIRRAGLPVILADRLAEGR